MSLHSDRVKQSIDEDTLVGVRVYIYYAAAGSGAEAGRQCGERLSRGSVLPCIPSGGTCEEALP